MVIKNKIEEYIVDFCAYDDEPLHIIISAIIDEGTCQTPKQIVDTIIKLAREGYVTVSTHSGFSGDNYVPIGQIDEHEIISYIEQRRSFNDYPDGKEYFVKTSQEGMKLLHEM